MEYPTNDAEVLKAVRDLSLTNKFPEAIDSSMLAAYADCPTRFHYSYIDNWKLKGSGKSIHLHAGGCYAKGLEIARSAYYNDGISPGGALVQGLEGMRAAWGDYEVPKDTPKTLDRMLGALEFYFDNYPLDTDAARIANLAGRNAIEFSFAIPIPVLHPTTGNPIILCGRCDAIAEYAKGLYAMDEKTTSSLGASWGKQWDLRGQFTGYAWAMRELGLKPAGSIVRGISILKTMYGAAEAIVPQPDWKITRWYKEALGRIEAMKRDYAAGEWTFNLGESCNHYGGCAFKQPCMSPTPHVWLNTYYEKEEWLPLNRH